MYYKTEYTSPIGTITIASDGTNIIGLWLEGQKYFADTIKEQMHENNNLSVFIKAKEWLDRYFTGKKPDITELPLAPAGNSFRQAIWEILCKIPYGKTMTYGEIARIIAKQNNKSTMSAQAIGGAVGHNPISIIIPCHRVVGSNGNLTGYAGGLHNKIKLLEHEGAALTKKFIHNLTTIKN